MHEKGRPRDELPAGGADDEYVAYHAAGEATAGSFRCAACGYGVAVPAVLPPCPMCAGESWERDLSTRAAASPPRL